MSASFDPPFDPDREGSDPDRPFPFLGPPQQDGDLGSLGEYRVVRELGRGGMGVVFRGEDTVLHRPVALKVMTPRAAAAENARDRFLREARAAAAISSEYVVRIHTVGETPPVGKAGGVPYLVMEYLEGCTLEDWLRGQGNTASAAVAVRIADDVLRGLADAHAKGLIHRDIKPQNIWLDAATGRFKLLDLGLTRAADGSGQVTRENVFVGTPQYVAPEQARNRPPDPRSDLFSLGVVIYRVLTGASPFTGDDPMACALAVCQDPHPPLDGVVPPALARYVDRLLAKEPTDRPASATAARSELADVLARLRNTRSDPDATDDYSSDAVILLPESARSYTITQDLQAILADPVRRRPKRWPWVVPLGVVGLVALGAATVALQSGTDPTPPTGPPVAVVTPTTTPDPGASDPQPPQAAPTLLDCTGPNGVTSDVVAAARAGWARHLGVSVEATVPLSDRAAMTFALVPPGTFTMGSPTDETDRGENELSHRVTLTRTYFMGVTEVTQAQYRAITGQNPSTFSGDERPVEQVTWDDAVAFAAELTARRDDGFVYRLPTEAEWEYAGRAGRPAGLPFGIGTGTDLSADEANFDGRSPYGARVAGEYRQATTPVGSFGANAFGLDDMHGNVWEWCRDTYAEYPSGPGTDPTGPNDGLRKVHRGGSWQDAGYACRAARRDWDDADAADPRIGFRLVRVLQD